MFSKLIRFWLLAVATMLALGMSVAWAGDLEDGLAAYQAKDYAKALQLLRPAAEKGAAKAQATLSAAYFNGFGVTTDAAAGVKWARLAADQGDPGGQNSTGYSYLFGRGGISKDYAQALKWFNLSAKQGYANAQSNIAYMYLNGLGVTKDYAESLRWFRLATAQDHAASQYYVGTMYFNGFGVTKDSAEALKWYRLAAAQGFSSAQSELAYMYRSGTAVTKDYDEALRLARLSAAQGHRGGQFHVGYMYLSGFGVTKDYGEALKWFRLAAAQGQVDAQHHIGWMYESGLGVNLDIEEAARWYLKAAALGYEAAKKKLESTWAMKSAAERVAAVDALSTGQKTNTVVAGQSQKDQLAPAAADKDKLRVAEDARVKEQERVAQIAKVKEQERLAQEAAAREQQRLTEAARVKEQERVAQEARAKEQERLAQEERSKNAALAAARQRDDEVIKLRQQLAKLEDEKTSKDQKAVFATRRALVIGNDSYKQVAKLVNAREDARSIAERLQQVGYQVTLKLDVTEKEMKAALRTFKSQVEGGDEVLVFFAGHGVQLGAANYLLPIDIAGDSEEQIKDDAIQLQRMLDDMSERKAKFTLAMIDACRDNPFKTAGRAIAGGRGLAPTTAATGQMVIFSAGAGQQAMDKLGPTDTNKNGLFTRVFLKEMQKPGVSVDRVVRNVRNEVVGLAKSVGHEQVPAIYDQVVGEFYFRR